MKNRHDPVVDRNEKLSFLVVNVKSYDISSYTAFRLCQSPYHICPDAYSNKSTALPCHGIPSMTAASLSAGPESGSSSFRGVGKQTIQSSWMNDPDSSLKTYRLIVLKAMVTWGYHGMTAMTCYDYGNPPPGTGTHGCA